MAVAKVQTGIRLVPSMYGKLKRLAKDDTRTVNNLVEFILRRYLDEYEREHGEIEPIED